MAKKRSPPLAPFTFKSAVIFFSETLWFLLLIFPSIIIAALSNFLFKPKKDLRGKIVLVTGSANGLGKEIALQLCDLGCTVLCVDIKEDDNKRTLKAILEKRGTGRVYTCDVSSPAETTALSEQILDQFGRVDVLINNAGLIYGNGILTGTNEEISRVLNVNFLSSLWMIRAFLPSMVKNKGGHIVIISSASGIHSLGLGSIYSSTKFALVDGRIRKLRNVSLKANYVIFGSLDAKRLREYMDIPPKSILERQVISENRMPGSLVYSMLEEFRNNDNFSNIRISCALPYFINTNKLYSEHWKLRLPAMSTEKAASLVIEGFRREFKFYTVPWITFGYNISSSLRILPMNVYNYFRDKCYADFTFDSSTDTKL